MQDTNLNVTLTGAAVTEALRSAHARNDFDAMRAICGDTPDDVLRDIGEGKAEVRGDSETEFSVWTIDRRYLVPTLIEGSEQIPRDEWIDVTTKSERAIERVMLGILRNMSDKYFIDDVVVPGVKL